MEPITDGTCKFVVTKSGGIARNCNSIFGDV